MTLDIDDYKTQSWMVAKGIEDALWTLSGQIDKHDVPAFFEGIQVVAPDHNNIDHTVFFGVLPNADYALASAADKALLTGYDYGWYLTVQYVPAGDRITDIDTNPSETIETLLGGTSWSTITGVEPHRINTVTDWANIKKVFEFGEKCTRWKAITEICEHCNFVFVVKWNGALTPQAYFVHDDDIDTAGIGLDLPAMVTITDPDSYLLDGVTIKDSPEKQYNRVKAAGYNESTQTAFSATAETAGVAAGTELAIEYVYSDTALDTQAKTETRAQELLDFFQTSAKVYVARFKHRMDLELYQKIKFSGYTKIDADEMRITRIAYSRSVANDTVEIEFTKDQAIQQLKRIARAVSPDYVSGQQEMIEDDLSNVGLIKPLGYEYMRIDANAGEQDMYVDLDMMDDTILAFINNSATIGNLYAFDGTSWTGMTLESKSAENLNVRAAGDLKLYAGADIFFEDINNSETSLSTLVAAAGAGLWESPGAATRLKTPEPIILEDGLEFEGYHILEWSYGGYSLGQIYGFHGTTQYDFIVKSKNSGVLTLESASGYIDCSADRLSDVGSPVENFDAATKQYVDNIVAGDYLPLAGGTMDYEAVLDMNSGRIDNLSRIDPRALGVEVYDYYGNLSVVLGSTVSGLTLYDRIDMHGNDIINVDDITMGGTGSTLNMTSGVMTNVQDITMNGSSSFLNHVGVVDFYSRSAPSTATGRLYFSSSDFKFHYYTGAEWKTIATE